MSDQKVSEHYAGQSGERYLEQRQSNVDNVGYALNFAYFQPYLEARHNVLDFGCGNGGMLRVMNDQVAHLDALKVNAQARKIAEQTGVKVFASIEELPSEPTYDVVVSNHVLEHVRDVCGTLETLRNCIKPGGKLVTKLPINDIRAAHQRSWSRDDVDHHLQTWTPRLFANVLFESGYEVKECRIITSAWHPKLFPLRRAGLAQPAFWLFAVVKNRRQLFAVGERPVD